jgi:hypothetical protein
MRTDDAAKLLILWGLEPQPWQQATGNWATPSMHWTRVQKIGQEAQPPPHFALTRTQYTPSGSRLL